VPNEVWKCSSCTEEFLIEADPPTPLPEHQGVKFCPACGCQPVVVGQTYRNTKTGGLYRVNDIPLHTEEERLYVHYVALETYTFEDRTVHAGQTFVRPLHIFAGLRGTGGMADGLPWRFTPYMGELTHVGHHPVRDELKPYSFQEFIHLAKMDLDIWYELYGIGAQTTGSRGFYREEHTFHEWWNAFHRWSSW